VCHTTRHARHNLLAVNLHVRRYKRLTAVVVVIVLRRNLQPNNHVSCDIVNDLIMTLA
jgi:hypothetical protein